MTGSREMASRLWIGLLLGACAGLPTAASAAPLGDAIALYKQKKYPEARSILGPLVAAEPSNAPACYFLAMTLRRSDGPSALDPAHVLLARAVRLAPGNAGYLAEYADVCWKMADRDKSFSLALEGRDAMTRSIAADPSDLDGREGLMQFYAQAPWPMGDPDKALALAAQIAGRDPKRGIAAYRKIEALFQKSGRGKEALSAEGAAQKLALGRPQ
jgi:predicted Zn-dependent protease